MRLSRLLLLSALSLTSLLPLSAAQAKPENGKTFANWGIKCVVPQGGTESICVTQTFVALNNQPFMMVESGYSPKDGTPVLGLLLPPQFPLRQTITVSVDGSAEQPVGWDVCHQGGCVANTTLSPALFSALKSGKTLSVTLTLPGQAKPVPATVPLDGYKQAVESLK